MPHRREDDQPLRSGPLAGPPSADRKPIDDKGSDENPAPKHECPTAQHVYVPAWDVCVLKEKIGYKGCSEDEVYLGSDIAPGAEGCYVWKEARVPPAEDDEAGSYWPLVAGVAGVGALGWFVMKQN